MQADGWDDKVMLPHLAETVKKHAYELLNRAETIRLVDNLKQSAPELVEEIVPNILSYAKLEKLLRNLLQEGVPFAPPAWARRR